MPLYTYKCVECNWEVEKFQHKPKQISVICEECESECERAIPMAKSKTWLNARDREKQVIDPEVERLAKKLHQGSDNDFVDLYGDI